MTGPNILLLLCACCHCPPVYNCVMPRFLRFIGRWLLNLSAFCKALFLLVQLLIANKGDCRFNFDQWISKHGLSSIKSIFQKHNATSFEALNGFTPQFNAIMIDPELTTKHGSLIPKLLQAMQSISQPERFTQRVVISEVEEIAMNKAAEESKRMMDDAFKFEETTRNIKANHAESLRKIKCFFMIIIAALKEREKELILELEEATKRRTDWFQHQVDALKEFSKRYDEINHQWNELLVSTEIDRNERKKKIVEESDEICKGAMALEQRSKRMMDNVGDRIAVTFGGFIEFINGLGSITEGDIQIQPVYNAVIYITTESTDTEEENYVESTVDAEWDVVIEEMRYNKIAEMMSLQNQRNIHRQFTCSVSRVSTGDEIEIRNKEPRQLMIGRETTNDININLSSSEDEDGVNGDGKSNKTNLMKDTITKQIKDASNDDNNDDDGQEVQYEVITETMPVLKPTSIYRQCTFRRDEMWDKGKRQQTRRGMSIETANRLHLHLTDQRVLEKQRLLDLKQDFGYYRRFSALSHPEDCEQSNHSDIDDEVDCHDESMTAPTLNPFAKNPFTESPRS